MRVWSLPDLQVLELLLELKAQQLRGFSWLILSRGFLWHRLSSSKGCGSAGSDSPHSPQSCLKIKHYKSSFHLPNSMGKKKKKRKYEYCGGECLCSARMEGWVLVQPCWQQPRPRSGRTRCHESIIHLPVMDTLEQPLSTV